MPNAVIKKYACTHDELLTDRISYVADDIETFVSSALKSPAAATAQSLSSARTTEKERKKPARTITGEKANAEMELDENSYRRAAVNDFFSNAFGPSQAELQANQPHSVRSSFEKIAGGFVQRQPAGTPRETLASVKEEMRKKKIRVDTKN